MKQEEQSSRAFVLVGHCVPDAYMLRTAIERSVPGAKVVTVNDDVSLGRFLTEGHVLLVNRVLDGSFAEGDGIALIGRIAGQPNGPAAALVSNLPDAQRRAEQVGALPGFGKSAVVAPETGELIRGLAVNMQQQNAESGP